MMPVAQVVELIDELRQPNTTPDKQDHIKFTIVQSHEGLIYKCIRTSDPELRKDLYQLGVIGILKAIETFDPDREVAFSTHAFPRIQGEISHYLRDNRTIRVPRALAENTKKVLDATDQLTRELQRSPTVGEVSLRTELSKSEILEALEHAATPSVRSLEEPGTGEPVPAESDGYAFVEIRETLRPLLASLTDYERSIIEMCFFQNLSRAHVARKLGTNPTNITRQINSILAQLRSQAGSE